LENLNEGMLNILCRRDDNIKKSVEEAECENVYWFGYAENSCHSQFPVNMAVNLTGFLNRRGIS
jgi:hypothetical protein